MRRFAVLSVLVHGVIAAAFLLRFAPGAPPPTQWAKVELIQQPTPTVGDGGIPTGRGTADTPATAPPPVPPSPPPAPAIPPSVADLPPVPTPADMPPTPEPAPPSPPQPAAASVPVPPPAAPKPAQPTPVKQARASPPIPRTRPPSPPTDAPTGELTDPPEIRLGDGGQAGTGLVSGPNIIPAELDSTVRNRPPPYPPEAARRGESGRVLLRIHVAPDGSASRVEVEATSGFDRLDRAALDAVSHWHFKPAWQNGAPVASESEMQLVFDLKE